MPSSPRCQSTLRRLFVERLIISDIPTPWREPVFERVYQRLGSAVHTVYFKGNEKRRLWTFKMGCHPKTILKGMTLTNGGTERFFNPGIVPLLLRRRPRAALVFASIKDPTAWLAMMLCRLLRIKVALLDDSWLGRDHAVNGLQRLARRIVYNSFGDAYVGTSRQTLAMFRHYNPRVRDEQCFLSHLVADNDYFQARLRDNHLPRRYDIVFAGRIVAVKNPLFFAEVCAGIKTRLGKCSVLIIGDGDESLKTGMREVFDRHGIDYEFGGFIPHEKLPEYYSQAKVLLLPTSGDCWGVVINEAMVAGTPVVTTEMTAAAGELVVHGENGYVLPLDKEAWSSAVIGLLFDQAKWDLFSKRAREKVSEFNFDSAATGIVDAFDYLENFKSK